jgi:threonine dehydrogenase-like Zn-dependent dehydrogenase
MHALWLENRRPSLRTDLPCPEPGPGETLVRVRLAGICATDLEMVKGYYPFTGVMGHEFVGETASPGALPIGTRVVGEINVVCGTCAECLAGRPSHCRHRTVLGISNLSGSFAEYLLLPERNLLPVPDNVPDDMAVFTEPLAAALQIQEQVALHPSDRVLLIGAGRLGQLIAQTLTLTGCDLKVVVRSAAPRQLLADRGIATLRPEEVQENSCDLAVEATGAAAGLALARHAVHPGGTIVLKSTYAGDTTLNLSQLVVNEITVVGSRCGPFAPALRLLASGYIDPRPLITARYDLDAGLEGLHAAAQPGALKVLLTP